MYNAPLTQEEADELDKLFEEHAEQDKCFFCKRERPCYMRACRDCFETVSILLEILAEPLSCCSAEKNKGKEDTTP